jgi:hypothetical protein
MVKMSRLDFQINDQFYPKGKKSLTPFICNRGKGQLNDTRCGHEFLDQERSQHLA